MTEQELEDKKYEFLEKCIPHLTAVNGFLNSYRKYGIDTSVQVRICEGQIIVDVMAETDTFAAKTLARQLEQKPEAR